MVPGRFLVSTKRPRELIVPNFERSLAEFRDQLASHERTVLVDQLDVIDKGVEWLLRARSAHGFWGVEDVAETSLCCIAIARWRPADAASLLEESGSWLCKEAVDGAWDTAWDSGVAVQALMALNRGGEVTTIRALERLQELDESNSSLTSEPHHAAQVLEALRAGGLGGEALHRWSRRIHQSVSGRDEIYVVSQCVTALLESGTATSRELSEAKSVLKAYLLRQARPSEGELRSFAPAVQALAHVPDCSALVQEKAATIVGAWSDSRAWYKSPRHTSVALLALHAAGSSLEIAIDKPSFNAAFTHAFDELPQELVRERAETAAIGAGLMLLLVLGVLLIALWNDTDSLLVNGVLITALVIAVPATIRALVARVWNGAPKR